MGFMAEQSLQFFLHKIFEGRSEFEVNAGHDDFVGWICFVHGFSFGFTTQNLRMKCLPGGIRILEAVLADRPERYSEKKPHSFDWKECYALQVSLQFFSASSLGKLLNVAA